MTSRVLLYGDSNTFGTMPMAGLEDDGIYPKQVRWGGHLAAGLGGGWDVVVEGLPGRTSVFDDPVEGEFRNGLRILPAILMSHRPIDVLVIALGTNDQKLRFGLGAQDVALGIKRLVEAAMVTGEVNRVLVVAPPPLAPAGDFVEMFAGAENRMAGLADGIARFAGEAGAAFFDAGRVIAVDPVDGIHWSAAAHRDLGVALTDVIRGLAA